MTGAMNAFIERFLELGRAGGVLFVASLLSKDPTDWVLWVLVGLYFFDAVFAAVTFSEEEEQDDL